MATKEIIFENSILKSCDFINRNIKSFNSDENFKQV